MMSRFTSHSFRMRLSGGAVLGAMIALLAVAPAARAGIGDLMKKAQDKVAKEAQKKTVDEKPCPPPEFDAVVVELTNDRIKRILATFEAAGAAGAGRPALVDKLNKLNEDYSKLDDKHGEAIRELQRKRGDVETCYHDGYQDATDRRMKQYADRALTDPALLAKYSELAKGNQAAMKGDTAMQKKILEGMYEEVRPTKEDSAQVRKSCGPVPPKSGPEQQREALDVQIRTVQDSIAVVDERVAKAQAKQSGLDPSQWMMALERLTAYSGAKKRSSSKGGTAICGYTKTEVEAIEANLPQINARLGL
jgi:hypothetical protein